MHTFPELLSGADLEDDFDEVESYYPECECFHIEGDPVDNDGTNVAPSELTPSLRATYLQEKAERLKAR